MTGCFARPPGHVEPLEVLRRARMKRVRGLLILLALFGAAAGWVFRKQLRQRFSTHVETREGILVRLETPVVNAGPKRPREVKPGQYCVLVHTYTPSGPSDQDQLEDRFWSSDGLEASYCETHEELLNHRIQITAIRTTGEAIDQDCTNRSCFDSVLPSGY